jgi:hypothetical protein
VRRIRRLAAERRVQFTLKALRELAALELGLDAEDACDILAGVKQADLADRIQSEVTGEWMYVFKTRVESIVVYLKVVLRSDCLVISFHEDEDGSGEEGT